jgi:hypothetical protein
MEPLCLSLAVHGSIRCATGWCMEEIGDEWHVRILVVVVSADSLPSSCQVLNARNTGWIRGSNCSPLQKLSKIHALTRVGSAR